MAAELLTVEETASRLRCSVSTVRRLIRTGTLPAFRLGGKRNLLAAIDVQHYIEEQRRLALERRAK